MSDKTIHIDEYDSEADTCRKEVLPKLYESQWTEDLILEQRTFTDGKIIIIGRKARRKKRNALTTCFAIHKTFQ